MIIPFSYILNIITIILLDLVGLYLSFWVYLSDRKKALNRGFPLFIIPNLLWINFYSLAFLLSDSNLSLLFTRLTFAAVFVFFIGFYYFFIIWFLNEKGWYVTLGKVVIIYEVIFGFLCIFTGLIIEGFRVGKWGIIPTFSLLGNIVFHLPIILLVLLVISKLTSRYFKSPIDLQKKIEYFLIGVYIFVLGNLIIGVILPFFFKIYDYYFVTNYLSIILLVFTAYAIVKHRLFDIKVLISQILVFAIWICLVIRMILSNNPQELLINSFFALLVFIIGILLLLSLSKETKLIKENLRLEQELHKKLAQKTGEMIKKMEDIVKE